MLNLNIGFDPEQSSSLPSPISDDHEEVDEKIKEILKDHDKYIKSFTRLGRIMETFNFKMSIFSPSELCYHFKKVFKKQKNSFKINISMAYLLENKTTGELAYYRSSQNNQLLFSKPVLIRNSQDKESFKQLLENTNLLEKIQRPDSKWTFLRITNITFYVYRLSGSPIGALVNLPTHLLNNKGLHSLIKNKRGRNYDDKKCFFRC